MSSQTITPMIAYQDGFAALDWLARVFGFRELTRMATGDGRLAHGEMDVGGGEGATILSEVEDGPPGPRYRTEDIEGHRWMFIER